MLGQNIKLYIRADTRPRFSAVMQEVFGASIVLTNERIEIYDLGGARIGAETATDDVVLDPERARTAGTWLEFLVPDVTEARTALAKHGVTPFEYTDKTHDYYQLPGGQVVRVAKRG